MKRVGGLFEEICSYPNLLRASRSAERGKRYRPDVLEFNLRREDRIVRLARVLREDVWRPGEHRHFEILEPKRRWISAAPYEDRVVHHAVCNVIGPVLDRRMIFDCWANRDGKGTHRAVLRYQRFSTRYRFALKMDIRKYFASIDHVILKQHLGRAFNDQRLLRLINMIVDTGRVPEPHHVTVPGDDLFVPFARTVGLSIGNLTSQLWSNSYLCAFDHWVKEELCAPAYLRFVDDFVLLHDSKGALDDYADRVRNKLFGLRLELHANKCVIRRVSEGLPFLGYVVWPDRIRVRGETVRRFRRRYRRLRLVAPERAAASLAAWQGHVRLSGTWRRRSLA